MDTTIKPCPFCGNRNPFTYISFSCAVLRCSCGVEVSAPTAAVRVCYRERKDIPTALMPYTYPTTALAIREGDKVIEYPHHGYVGVSAPAAFAHSGALEIWNRRAA